MGRIIRIFLVITGIVGITALGLNFWAVARIKDLIFQEVEDFTDNRHELKIDHIKFYPFKNLISISGTDLRIYSTLKDSVQHQVTIKKLEIRYRNLFEFFQGDKLSIESAIVTSPEIRVLLLAGKDPQNKNQNLDLQKKLVDLYETIQALIQTFEVKEFQIRDASLELDLPYARNKKLHFSNIQLGIENLGKTIGDTSIKSKLLFTDNLIFAHQNQTIIFPDSQKLISYKAVRFSKSSQSLELLHCKIKTLYDDQLKGSFETDVKSIRFIRPDFISLKDNGILKVDSIILLDPVIKLSFAQKNKKRELTTSLPPDSIIKKAVGSLIGNLDVKFVGLYNNQLTINAADIKNKEQYNFRDSRIKIHNLSIHNDRYPEPVQVDSFHVSLEKYESQTRDGKFHIFFDNVELNDEGLSLNNFILQNRQMDRNREPMAIAQSLVLKDPVWSRLLFEKEFQAHEVTLVRPQLTLYSADKKQLDSSNRKTIYQALEPIRELIDLQVLNIRNGDITYHIPAGTLTFLGISLQTNPQAILRSRELNNLMDALYNLSFREAILDFRNTWVNLRELKTSPKDSNLVAGYIEVKDKDGYLQLNGKDIKIQGLRIQDEEKSIQIDSLNLGNSELKFSAFVSGKEKKRKIINLKIHSLNLGQCKADIQLNKNHLQTTVNLLKLIDVDLSDSSRFPYEKIFAQGKNLTWKVNGINASIEEYLLNESYPSYLRNANIKITDQQKNIRISAPRVEFTPEKISDGSLIHLTSLSLPFPTIEITLSSKNNSVTDNNQIGIPVVNNSQGSPRFNWLINQLSLIDPKLSIYTGEENKPAKFISNNSKIELFNIGSNETSSGFRFDELNLNFHEFLFEKKGLVINTAEGISGLNIEGRNSYWRDRDDFDTRLSFQTDNLSLKISPFSHSDTSVFLQNVILNAENIAINPNTIQKLSTLPFWLTQPLSLKNADLKYQFPSHQTVVTGIQFSMADSTLKGNSFALIPHLDAESFQKKLKWRGDHITYSSGPFTIRHLSHHALEKNGTLKAEKIDIQNAFLKVFRDNRLPFRDSVYKPLITGMFRKIKKDLNLDTLVFHNGQAEYSEFNEKTLLKGVVPFDSLQVSLINIKNHKFEPDDTFSLNATANLLEQIPIKMSWQEPYADSLHTSFFTVQAGGYEGKTLNDILIPLAGAAIRKGYVDTTSLSAIANEHVAVGKMMMKYQDLYVDILGKSSQEKKGMNNNLLSFITNTFVLRNKNKGKISYAYFERYPYKSFFNYWIKIILSGALSNTGIKQNKKMEKKHASTLKRIQLSPTKY